MRDLDGPIDIFEVDEDRCPYCDGLPIFLGQLGTLMWLRCRACHYEWEQSA